jgi:lipopolysaccharide transport system ATP-binding protein
VSFDVREGEILGIIGRNGAGKSTLLKILARVTGPSEGQIKLRGRIASLLEVGTGFHPELTGRENIFLNGAILGMTKAQIRTKFDEIVAFSGVEEFIDTPVKRYSSGMHVRLGFAVAAHLEPDILVVDEVLAVGDAAFQKKCVSKMEEVSSHGQTVLVVSHNMGTITSLCSRGVLLDQGQLIASGAASQVVTKYLRRGSDNPSLVDFSQGRQRVGDALATLHRAWFEDDHGEKIHEIDICEPFRIKMEYELHTVSRECPYPNFHVFDQRGDYVFVVASRNYLSGGCVPGRYVAQCHVPGNLMNDGCYFVGLALTFTDNGTHVSFFEKDALSICVRDPVTQTLDTRRLGYAGPMPGSVRPQLEWEIHRVS